MAVLAITPHPAEHTLMGIDGWGLNMDPTATQAKHSQSSIKLLALTGSPVVRSKGTCVTTDGGCSCQGCPSGSAPVIVVEWQQWREANYKPTPLQALSLWLSLPYLSCVGLGCYRVGKGL